VAWWMNAALEKVWAELQPEDTLLTYVHDSLCVESTPERIGDVQKLLHRCMEGVIEYRGRTVNMFPVESKIGSNLAVVK